MARKYSVFVLFVCAFAVFSLLSTADAAGPKGAKAIFDSGEGASTTVSAKPAPKPSSDEPVSKEKYTGIAYQLVLLSDDGQFKVVPKSRTFRSGERIKMLLRTNRPGYLTIVNIGSSGNTNVLFNEYVEAFAVHEIPKNTNFRFVGQPGTEKLLIMISDGPNPIVNQPAVAAGGYQPPPVSAPPPSDPGSMEPPPSSDMGSVPPPPPAIASNIEGAKRVGGAKDIVVEDGMQTSYAVISPKNNYKPVKMGMKDIVLESSQGNNYGVVPVSAISDGGILTLEVKLKHR